MVLSIIIVNWNTRELLAQCLASIYANPPQGSFEVIVVDNGSTDDSLGMVCTAFPQAHIIRNGKNVGFARANNVGIEHSQGEYILLLNSDTLVLPGSLDALLSAAERPMVGVVGPKLLNPDGSFQASGNDFPTLLSEVLLLTGLARWIYGPSFPSYSAQTSSSSRGCDWIGGACLLARRAAVEQVGRLDTTYFMYVEEVDWCYRFRRAGWQVGYCAEAEIIHYGGASASRTTQTQLQRLYASKAHFLARRYGPGTAALFRGAVRLVAVCQAARWWTGSKLGYARAHDKTAAYWGLARVEL